MARSSASDMDWIVSTVDACSAGKTATSISRWLPSFVHKAGSNGSVAACRAPNAAMAVQAEYCADGYQSGAEGRIEK
eukprot:scaffold4539_cov30-Tisochrysis_lutea.AAC.3